MRVVLPVCRGPDTATIQRGVSMRRPARVAAWARLEPGHHRKLPYLFQFTQCRNSLIRTGLWVAPPGGTASPPDSRPALLLPGSSNQARRSGTMNP